MEMELERREQTRRAVLIAGPTASGKSALALRLAAETDGVIVNTDSMQVYGVLRVLTARPDARELAQAPHRLYGHVPPSEHYSTGRWLDDVRAVIADETIAGRTLIFTGGTGLYFRALTQGLSPMPEVPDAVRRRWRHELSQRGAEALHRILRREDPDAAMTLRPSDGQRIVRALEVLEASGRSILAWQAEAGRPLVDAAAAERHLVMPERDTLHARIEARFDRMVADGALDEVKALIALDPDPAHPAMKAIGVRELTGYLRGEHGLDAATELAKTATRQYAKRQMTWFRNQLGEEWKVVSRPDDHNP